MPRQIITIEVQWEECADEVLSNAESWDIESALDEFYESTLSDEGISCAPTRTVTVLQAGPVRREDRDEQHREECDYFQQEDEDED
jgi:hypothetical protein